MRGVLTIEFEGRLAGWRGVLIEADPSRCEALRRLHHPLGNTALCRAVSVAPGSPDSLAAILAAEAPGLPADVDLVSIDIDGADYWVLLDLLDNFRPKVICCEFNPSMPNALVYIQPRSDVIRHGSSLATTGCWIFMDVLHGHS